MSAVLNAPHSASIDAGTLDITPLAGRIGAEIRGVRLSGSLQADTFAQIHQALLKHKVLFFRGQQHLDDAAQEAFGSAWATRCRTPRCRGAPGHRLHPGLDSAARRPRQFLAYRRDLRRRLPPKISVLRGVVIPPWGGDTVWANTAAAYQGLPPALRELADKLWAVHGNDYDYAAHALLRPTSRRGQQALTAKVFTRTLHEAEHPVVRVHPETRERALVLGHFVKKLVGYSSTIRSTCCRCCRSTSSAWRTPCAGAGRRATS
jgi:alpha-ketoglutarate-dependent taurine dioxygenase